MGWHHMLVQRSAGSCGRTAGARSMGESAVRDRRRGDATPLVLVVFRVGRVAGPFDAGGEAADAADRAGGMMAWGLRRGEQRHARAGRRDGRDRAQRRGRVVHRRHGVLIRGARETGLGGDARRRHAPRRRGRASGRGERRRRRVTGRARARRRGRGLGSPPGDRREAAGRSDGGDGRRGGLRGGDARSGLGDGDGSDGLSSAEARRGGMHRAQLTRRKGERGAEAVGRGHEQRASVTRPGQIGERGVVQVADDGEGLLLLRVVDVHRVLRRHGIHDADGIRERGQLVGGAGVDDQVFRVGGRGAQGVEDGRALDGDRGLPMPRQIGDGGFVQAGAGVDVDGVDDVVGGRPGAVQAGRGRRLELAGRGEEEAAVGRKGEAAEEGGEGFVGVEVGVADAQAHAAGQAGRGRGHDGGQGHRGAGGDGATHRVADLGAEGGSTAVRGRGRVHGQGERLRGARGGGSRGADGLADAVLGQGGAVVAQVGRGGAVGRDASAGEVHAGDLVVLGEGELAILGLERVDVHGAVGGLGGDVLVQGIPGDALDVVVVLGDLADDAAVAGAVDAGDVVHAAGDEELSVGGPGQVVDLGAARRTTHGLDAPVLEIVGVILAQAGLHGGIVRGGPQQDIAIVSGRGQQFSYGGWFSDAAGARGRLTARTPSHDVDGLGVLGEGGEVGDLAFVGIGFDSPELSGGEQTWLVSVGEARSGSTLEGEGEGEVLGRGGLRRPWPACPCRRVRSVRSRRADHRRARRPATGPPSWCSSSIYRRRHLALRGVQEGVWSSCRDIRSFVQAGWMVR
nr:hypothetical protein CFP56_09428 [Quercus suber]